MKQNVTQLEWKDLPSLRSKLLKKQGGVCDICGKIPKVPCLDHDHTKRTHGSGRCRGVLCSGCNIFLAKSENNCVRFGIAQSELPFILKQMSEYLKKPQLLFIHPSEKKKPMKVKLSSFKKLKEEYFKKYKKRKVLNFPKSRILTKKFEKLFKEFNIKIEYVKGGSK